MIKKINMKNLILTIVLLLGVTSISIYTYTANAIENEQIKGNNSISVEVSEETVSDPQEILKYLDIHYIDQSNDIAEIVKIRFDEEKFFAYSKGNKYSVELISNKNMVENIPSINHTQPNGVINIEEQYNSSWSISSDEKIGAKIIESALGLSLTEDKINKYQWKSRHYPYATNVKGHLVHEYITYNLCSKKEFIGSISIKRIIGYDIIVYRN